MPSPPVSVGGPVGIRQIMNAGSNFDGVAPDLAGVPIVPTYENYLYTFAGGDKGGLFDPSAATLYGFNKPDAVDLIGVEIDLADQTSWKIEKLSADASLDVIEVWTGTTESEHIVLDPLRLVLLWGEKFRLTTAAATATMRATLKFEPHKTGRVGR